MPSKLLSLFLLGITGVQAHGAVSKNGRCGRDNGGVTCTGSVFGSCCSSKSWCGTTSDHCGAGCQIAFGSCGSTKPPSTKPVSKDGRCGAKFNNQTCGGSKYGDCCSQYSYCGGNNDYCDARTCQKGFGRCNDASESPSHSTRTTLSSVVVPSSSASQPTCSALTITLPAPPASTVTIPGSEVTTLTVSGDEVTVTSTIRETVTIPGDISTIISTVVETVTQAPSCAEVPTSTSDIASSTTSELLYPTPTYYCLELADRNPDPEDRQGFYRISIIEGSRTGTYFLGGVSEQPAQFLIDESNRLFNPKWNWDEGTLTSYTFNAVKADVPGLPFVDIYREDPDTIANNPYYGLEVCSFRTDIEGYEGRQVLRCSATVGDERAYDQFALHRRDGLLHLVATRRGTPSEDGFYPVELVYTTDCGRMK